MSVSIAEWQGFMLDPEQSVLVMLGKDYGNKSLQGLYTSI